MPQAVSTEHIDLIKELQALKALQNFALAGGTNLAYRYGHRKSIDIDLFCSENIGREGFYKIESELKEKFNNRILKLNYPYNESDQDIFLRALIRGHQGTFVKVEILHNMKRLDEIEIIGEIKLVSIRDIGLYKLVSASSRKAAKDIYDLNYITKEIPLIELFEELKIKKKRFSDEKDQSIFDRDDDCPVINPKLLLAFDQATSKKMDMPIHSDHHLDLLAESQKWNTAKFDWRNKVRALFRQLDIEFPSIISELK